MYKIIVISFAVLIALAVPAQAQDQTKRPFYLSGAFGLSVTDPLDWTQGNRNGDVEHKKVANFAAALGVSLNSYFSTELEFSYRSAKLDELTVYDTGSADLTGELEVWAGLINGYFNMAPHWNISPFLTLGLGLARHSAEIGAVPALGAAGVDDTSTVLAYQAGMGFNYRVSPKTQLWLGYRYLGTERPRIGNTEFDYGVHETRLGLRHLF